MKEINLDKSDPDGEYEECNPLRSVNMFVEQKNREDSSRQDLELVRDLKLD